MCDNIGKTKAKAQFGAQFEKRQVKIASETDLHPVIVRFGINLQPLLSPQLHSPVRPADEVWTHIVQAPRTIFQ